MKKTTILNAKLSHTIATLGHTDALTICDAGLPIPEQQNRIDLALSPGIPDFLTTLKAVLSELFIERLVLAEEIKTLNPRIAEAVLALIAQTEAEQGNQITIEYVAHSDFKTLSNQSKAVLRTGECSPYANVILYSGVPF